MFVPKVLITKSVVSSVDVFRTNQADFNTADTSSYLDLSPLYGHTEKMQKSIRTFKDGLLWPDTFAEDRLLRQPPGVNIMLVMYNRYHNYVAKELKKINEGGRFSLPPYCYTSFEDLWQQEEDRLKKDIKMLEDVIAGGDGLPETVLASRKQQLDSKTAQLIDHGKEEVKAKSKADHADRVDAAKVKQDYDLFNTARLYDYLR